MSRAVHFPAIAVAHITVTRSVAAVLRRAGAFIAIFESSHPVITTYSRVSLFRRQANVLVKVANFIWTKPALAVTVFSAYCTARLPVTGTARFCTHTPERCEDEHQTQTHCQYRIFSRTHLANPLSNSETETHCRIIRQTPVHEVALSSTFNRHRRRCPPPKTVFRPNGRVNVIPSGLV